MLSRKIKSRIAVIAMVVMLATSSSLVPHSGAQSPEPVDLSGIWTTEQGWLVQIVQSGQSVSATWLTGGYCPQGPTAGYAIRAELTGSALAGTLAGCTDSELFEACDGNPIIETPMQAQVQGTNRLVVTFVQEVYDMETCEYVFSYEASDVFTRHDPCLALQRALEADRFYVEISERDLRALESRNPAQEVLTDLQEISNLADQVNIAADQANSEALWKMGGKFATELGTTLVIGALLPGGWAKAFETASFAWDSYEMVQRVRQSITMVNEITGLAGNAASLEKTRQFAREHELGKLEELMDLYLEMAEARDNLNAHWADWQAWGLDYEFSKTELEYARSALQAKEAELQRCRQSNPR